MIKVIEWKNIVEESSVIKKRKNGVQIYIDCIYKNKTYAQNYSGDVISVMMPGSGNQGGFRPADSKNGKYPTYVVLYSTNNDPYWTDELDEETGLYVYYGDNKIPGNDLHSKKGNQILRETFDLTSSDQITDRKKIAPFFLFDRDDIGGVKFRGLLVPGFKSIPSREWLTAIWAKLDEGGRFQNYKSLFTILDISTGCLATPNEASIDLRWIDDIRAGRAYDSVYAPFAWKEWIDNPTKYKALTTPAIRKIRTKEEQLPSDPEHIKMLDMIVEYFSENRYDFELMAIRLVTCADNNILEDPMRTRSVKDGGFDGVGEYRIMTGLKTPLFTTFAIEAKCKKRNNAVRVQDTSRLISRIRHRQFGVFVTTSYVDDYAYNEIIEDDQPISIISGIDIIKILESKENVNNCEQLEKYLINNFPKTIIRRDKK